jgi:hypothetical protein
VKHILVVIACSAAAGAVVSCGGSSAPPEAAPGCNPLIGDDCMSPFPSAFYEGSDATTATGVRVNIPDSALPVIHGGSALSGARFALHDGISPSTPFVVYFAEGVDATQLPTLATLDQSVMPTSTVQVIDVATGARVPVMAELDANYTAGIGQHQALIIRPQVRLAAATRYVIALVGLNDATGKPLAPAPFVALRDNGELSKSLAAVAPRYDDIFAALKTAGVDRAQVNLAWDIVTASDADLTGHLVAMRDQALTMTSALTWTITSQTDFTSGSGSGSGSGSDAGSGSGGGSNTDPYRLRDVVGTFQVPSFLTNDTLTAVMNVDGSGAPLLRGLGSADFAVEIPQCALTATGPLPVIVFGHGLFGTAPAELDTEYERQVGDFLCAVQIGTDWSGLAQYDFPILADDVLPNFNQLHIVTRRCSRACSSRA